MKLMMILGGLVGFSIAVGLGIAQDSAWPAMLWRASAAALLAGMLMRWWAQLWIRSLEQSRRERLAAAEPSSTSPLSRL